mmetsp:Transcript_1893/g.4278  ORF Transcript_1893/g.4278 Transcript_1893/m.4278 type:complete len:214 (+) Transcript_1893:43-684(+)|eukprot:CAMPEP_0197574918 /NCGR_PEP_ID=MMETSP1326-20131121/493_1 /TAXON_ID=1155430 /ORGANISM="Genus nov. species nov., Strain RCC2288" /LENGTH=213 /DNA_ID=CAMNT_0043137587 /DNA_START=41 /DNA_END=682 /DNA_ORIENTATION=+
MGISRDSLHKRRLTGGKQKPWRKKRKYELGRQAAGTKLSSNVTVRQVRCRGGNIKFRALRLDTGNFAWGSENTTHKTRILDVNYNSSNMELVRTKTLVKNAVVQVDAAPFRTWYMQHYGKKIGVKVKNGEKVESEDITDVKRSNTLAQKLKERNNKHAVAIGIDEQFSTGRLFALITSRPGQCGRCDGYILEGKELEFYQKKMAKKGSKASKD